MYKVPGQVQLDQGLKSEERHGKISLANDRQSFIRSKGKAFQGQAASQPVVAKDVLKTTEEATNQVLRNHIKQQITLSQNSSSFVEKDERIKEIDGCPLEEFIKTLKTEEIKKGIIEYDLLNHVLVPQVRHMGYSSRISGGHMMSGHPGVFEKLNEGKHGICNGHLKMEGARSFKTMFPANMSASSVFYAADRAFQNRRASVKEEIEKLKRSKSENKILQFNSLVEEHGMKIHFYYDVARKMVTAFYPVFEKKQKKKVTSPEKT